MHNMCGGLASGTRLTVTERMDDVIEAKVVAGPAKDTNAYPTAQHHTI